jgi:hypothetical protein
MPLLHLRGHPSLASGHFLDVVGRSSQVVTVHRLNVTPLQQSSSGIVGGAPEVGVKRRAAMLRVERQNERGGC